MKKWTRREFLPLIGVGLAGTAFVTSGNNRSSKAKNRLIEIPRYIRPKSLKIGDTIGICAPAGALKREEEVAEFTKILNDFGFQVKVGANVHKKHGYFAGTDAERAEDFMNLVEDDEVQGIFFLRGGWGCARILPLIDFDAIRKHPKVIMGFSDLTSLLNAITERSQIVTFHGPGGNSSWNTYSNGYIRSLLIRRSVKKYQNTPEDHAVVTYSGGKAYGTLWGGNLSVLVSMIGTPYFPRIDDGLLFLEEVGEEPYRIDRMLTQLKQTEILQNCNGVILGNFRKCTAEEPDRSFTLEEVFEQHFSEFGKPVYYGAQIGHTVNKFTVPIGMLAQMDADEGTFQLSFQATVE